MAVIDPYVVPYPIDETFVPLNRTEQLLAAILEQLTTIAENTAPDSDSGN